jgi:stearoyl-CoA desaturase (delta-9 desaturase)
MTRFIKSIISFQPVLSLIRWFDSEAGLESVPTDHQKKVDWFRIFPFVFLHVMCLGVIWVGWSWTAVIVALLLYIIRMFSLSSAFWAMPRFNGDRCGGPHTIGIIIAMPTGSKMSIPRFSTDFGGATLAG